MEKVKSGGGGGGGVGGGGVEEKELRRPLYQCYCVGFCCSFFFKKVFRMRERKW